MSAVDCHKLMIIIILNFASVRDICTFFIYVLYRWSTTTIYSTITSCLSLFKKIFLFASEGHKILQPKGLCLGESR